VAWNGNPSTFAASTAYTATITLTAKTGYTLQGVTEDFFTVAGATSVSNSANSGVVTAVFPQTAATVNIAAILGVTAPATEKTPVAAIPATAQYTGTVAWNPAVSGTFAAETVYTATITLTAKTGYTLQGVTEDFFTVALAPGGTSVSNAANSGVVTAVFPQTVYSIGNTGPGGGKIFYVSETGFTFYKTATDTTGVTAHYLEAAPQDWPEKKGWALQAYASTDISGTETGIGTGRRNTRIILAANSSAPAARTCYDLNQGGKTDWFLPSKDELNLMYNNPAFKSWEITTDHYWSSSQKSATHAWDQSFSTGAVDFITKTSARTVRPIRAF
jgi:hypothetical protein